MIPDTCSFCKGKLREGKKEFVVKVKNEVVVIRDVPALVCDCCDEAYITPEISKRLMRLWKNFTRDASWQSLWLQGKLC